MDKERGCSHRMSFTLFLKSSFCLVCYLSKQCCVFCSLSLVLIGCCFPQPSPSPILIETDLHSHFCHIHTAGRDSRCLWVFGKCLFVYSFATRNLTVLPFSSLQTLNLTIQWLLLAKIAVKAWRTAAAPVSSALGFLKWKYCFSFSHTLPVVVELMINSVINIYVLPKHPLTTESSQFIIKAHRNMYVDFQNALFGTIIFFQSAFVQVFIWSSASVYDITALTVLCHTPGQVHDF
jgi:hypothetical protein